MSVANHKTARVIGLGNVLLGDDGLGPLVIERLRAEYECGPDVEIVDLGPPGLDLTPYLSDASLVVCVDAVLADDEPGSLHIYNEGDLLNRSSSLRVNAHDPGILESLMPLRLSGLGPSEFFLVGLVPQACQLGEGLSPTIIAASTEALLAVTRLLTCRGYACQPRKVSFQPNLWWLSGMPSLSGVARLCASNDTSSKANA